VNYVALIDPIPQFAIPNLQFAMTRPIVIAHRGASGYLPEHTLEAKALAYAMGADYLEQDCVLTADDVPVVLHDVHLDTISDVAQHFPDRRRDDGRYYAIDFTLAEIKTLRVTERIDLMTGQAVYPGRFPIWQGDFSIPTLAQELQFIRGLNRSTGRNVGIYPEIKKPAWHRQQGKDPSRVVIQTLHEHGYATKEDACYVQCFDAAECERIRTELGWQGRLIQLIGENSWKESPTDYDALRTAGGLQKVAEYADGIGPAIPHIISGRQGDDLTITSMVSDAHDLGLAVHPYTARADGLPDWADDIDTLLKALYDDAKVDGLFCDHPDHAVRMRDALAA
jgi:glycerophosphoryl diester phosphodiesterase